jgi:hypothetical protein
VHTGDFGMKEFDIGDDFFGSRNGRKGWLQVALGHRSCWAGLHLGWLR